MIRKIRQYFQERSAKKLREKQFAVELDRVNRAMDHLREWNDIPLSWQISSLCDILEIKADQAGHEFCIDLMLRDRKASAEALLACRQPTKANTDINR